MKEQQNYSTRASALHITFSVALLLASVICLASAAVATPTLGDYPDTSLPLSTDTTVIPDAAPTDTTSINVSTSTDFNGTLTGDPTTGVVRVTDAHPAGTYTVTVTAFDSGGGSATETFALTVTTPETCNPVYFATTNARAYALAVVVGDFNGDGKQDLATANGESFNVSILLGDGTGSFSFPRNFTVGTGKLTYDVAVGDFNGDGNQDLAVAIDNSVNVSIFLGDSTGNFSAPTSFSAGSGQRSVAVGDFNGDGNQDLALAHYFTDDVSILLGDGTGNFSAPTNFPVGDNPGSIVVGDFNGDGNQDLAVTNGGSDDVSILLGDGTGNFSAATDFAAGLFPLSATVGDFNGDGNQDLATANATSDNVSILLGDGTGRFSVSTSFPADNSPGSVAVGDFNGDGNQDLATANYFSLNVSILLGDGTGNLSPPSNFPVGFYPLSVAVGDFNSDGNQDLATANEFSRASILLRDCLISRVSQITAAGTTCSEFSSGTAQSLGTLRYRVDPDSQLIDGVNPRAFLYWVMVTAPAGNNTFAITQTIATGNFNSFFAVDGNETNVFDSDCVGLQRKITQSGDTMTITFNAPTAGTYFVAIKYNSRENLVGEPAPSPGTTVHYDFMTIGVSDSTSGLDLVEN